MRMIENNNVVVVADNEVARLDNSALVVYFGSMKNIRKVEILG